METQVKLRKVIALKKDQTLIKGIENNIVVDINLGIFIIIIYRFNVNLLRHFL